MLRVKYAMVGVVAATALVGGLVGAGTAGASTSSSETQLVQAVDSSVRAPSATKPGTKCTKKQKGKTRNTKYGKLECTKTGKKYVWKKAASPTPAPTAPTPAPTAPTPAPPAPVSCATGGGVANTCVVGATGPGGGPVFYVNDANSHGSRYLEAAPDGWNTGTDPTAARGCNGITIIGVDGLWIGAGAGNTTAFVNGCATSGIAARLADDYAGGSQTDWFLPSQDELNQLCKYARNQLTTVERRAVVCDFTGTLQGGFAAGSWYWSSSQHSVNRAWAQFFGNGDQNNDTEFSTGRVRPVRAF